jgi:hypothetical protein
VGLGGWVCGYGWMDVWGKLKEHVGVFRMSSISGSDPNIGIEQEETSPKSGRNNIGSRYTL